MKICVAQIRPQKGEIETNLQRHIELIRVAIRHEVDIIIFPELSLSSYEPTLAQDLAKEADDVQLSIFQDLSDTHQITIGIGVPTRTQTGICISMIIFHPYQARQVYSKKYLHEDELPFFVNGQNDSVVIKAFPHIALAICYELSIPEHAQNAHRHHAQVYIASVAKTAEGVQKASKQLSHIASQYNMTVLMSNCVGYCDDFESAGQSAVWNQEGRLLGQLDAVCEGILVIDTETQAVFSSILV